MARILIPILLITIIWSGYWFWGANDNLENIFKSLENPKSGPINIKYGSTSQVGFPNRYDVTVNNLSIENPNGKQIATFPFIQVIRLIYNKTHQIIIFPNELSIYNFNIKWENAKASIVKDTFEDRLIIEAENLMINDEKEFRFQAKKLQISLLYEKFVNAKPEIIVNFLGIETERQNIEFKLQLKTNLNFIDTPTLDVVNFLNSISQPKTWIELSKEDYKIDESFSIGNQEFRFSSPAYQLFK